MIRLKRQPLSLCTPLVLAAYSTPTPLGQPAQRQPRFARGAGP